MDLRLMSRGGFPEEPVSNDFAAGDTARLSIALTCFSVDDNCDITNRKSFLGILFCLRQETEPFTGNSLAPISTAEKTPDESKISLWKFSPIYSFPQFPPLELWLSCVLLGPHRFPLLCWRQRSKSLHTHFLQSFLLLGEHCECQSTRLLSSKLINLLLETRDCPNWELRAE